MWEISDRLCRSRLILHLAILAKYQIAYIDIIIFCRIGIQLTYSFSQISYREHVYTCLHNSFSRCNRNLSNSLDNSIRVSRIILYPVSVHKNLNQCLDNIRYPIFIVASFSVYITGEEEHKIRLTLIILIKHIR